MYLAPATRSAFPVIFPFHCLTSTLRSEWHGDIAYLQRGDVEADSSEVFMLEDPSFIFSLHTLPT